MYVTLINTNDGINAIAYGTFDHCTEFAAEAALEFWAQSLWYAAQDAMEEDELDRIEHIRYLIEAATQSGSLFLDLNGDEITGTDILDESAYQVRVTYVADLDFSYDL